MSKKIFVLLTFVSLVALVTAPAYPAVSLPVPGNTPASETLEVQSTGSYDIQEGARQIRVWGNYAYIIDGAAVVRVIDISNPSSPHETGSITISPSGARHLEISGRYAYVANGSGFRVIDIKNPADLKDIGGYEEKFSGTSLEIKGNYVFLPGDVNHEMSVIDVSDPSAPVKTGGWDPQTLAFVWDIRVSGNYAYLFGLYQAIEVVDISTPSSPVFADSFSVGGSINQPAVNYHVSGKYMYMTVLSCLASYCSNYFKVFDVSNPKAVQALGNYKIPVDSEAVAGIFAAAPYVFCAQGSSGVRVVDAADPALPAELGVFNVPGAAADVFVSGGYIYVADANSGLKIFKVASTPTVKITNLENGQYIGDTVGVQVEASGSAGIAGVELYANGEKIDESSSGVCTFDWNAGAYPDGVYTLSVIAYDTANRTAAYEIYVIKDSSQPELALNRTQFYFGAMEQGVSTGAQDLFIDNSGGGTLNWSASGPGWLKLSPASGAGNALISLSVDTANMSAGAYTGVLTISDPQAVNSPVTVNVTLTIYPATGGTAPFGYFETPDDGAIVDSSIPVTGWCLDDIGVESVKIYRDPVSGEGTDPVYIGDAIFIEGARPDVESAYPQYPFNYKAGWGYLMLTNSLPGSGNGTFNFQAVALDKEGRRVTLGTKTITCDNAHAVKPFGAIDTPTQGGTAAGTNFVNFAWALTQLPNTVPVDGSTITVWVDGRPQGHPVYNNYREDIAALFPGLHNSNGALGYYYLDTTQFENGVHTISWSVTDNAKNSDAIGSRYFTIQNTELGVRNQGSGIREKRRGAPPWSPVFDSSSVISERYTPVRVKKGFYDDIEAKKVYPDDDGNIIIEIKELERVVIDLSDGEKETQRYAGYVVVGGTLKELPIGSTFDRRRGIFYWQPGPGFVCEYALVFTAATAARGSEKITKKISVRILPKFVH